MNVYESYRQQSEYFAKVQDFMERYPGVINPLLMTHDTMEFSPKELAIRLIRDVFEGGTFYAEMRMLLRGYE